MTKTSLILSSLVLSACASMGGSSGPSAVATLESTKGNTAKGTVSFTQVGDKVRVSANLTGLKPDAEHGFHVHEKGDCSSGDGMSAGPHYNPAAKAHGSLATDHHAGDLPNVKSDGYGNATASFDVPGLSIGSGAADIVGRGLIVHRDADDYKSQPAGNAGPRIACAVIQRS